MGVSRRLRVPYFKTPRKVTINKSIYQLQRKVDNGSFGQVFIGNRVQCPDQKLAIKIVCE